MYQKYFGFKERPFQLVPNPAYLFLSRSHEEAMAHLSYAVSEGDGFITIIGEVGTGKTTLCRAFIDGMETSSEIAYIFNPKLSAVELLKTVCDEFAIPLAGTESTKDLIDRLNRFLLEKKAAGRQVMLVIDEAQNLNQEVLEQIRLLSNLETNTEKLIQIVLVGQPELDDLLESRELRQLSQRITLGCRLMPLTLPETEQYIQHRIRIAARKKGVVFTTQAYRKIHAFSRGIPRLIHIVCDRALLVAYVSNREKITGEIVDAAMLELSPREHLGRRRIIEKRKTVLLGALLCLAILLLLVVGPMDSQVSPVVDKIKTFKIPSPDPAPADPPQTETPAVPEAEPLDLSEPADESAQQQPVSEISRTEPADEPRMPSALGAFLAGIKPSQSKKNVLSAALSRWGVQLPIREYPDKKLIDPQTYFVLTARENGFLIHQSQTGLGEICGLNLPVIFEFRPSEGPLPVFLMLSGTTDTTLTFIGGNDGTPIDIAPGDMDGLWTGSVYIPWINYYEYDGVIPITGSETGVITLKRILGEIGIPNLAPGPVYDDATKSAVKLIQEKYGIRADGLVGPLTKMILYNELPGLDIPHIRIDEPAMAETEQGGIL
jgi:general secretion pathway protein A